MDRGNTIAIWNYTANGTKLILINLFISYTIPTSKLIIELYWRFFTTLYNYLKKNDPYYFARNFNAQQVLISHTYNLI